MGAGGSNNLGRNNGDGGDGDDDNDDVDDVKPRPRRMRWWWWWLGWWLGCDKKDWCRTSRPQLVTEKTISPVFVSTKHC